jgi:aspartyl-tRNA(Asn)/glutamyl-tRNA(Gln) amidotransferase subunit C
MSSSQTIDTNTVKHVAHLVRLGISEEEAQKFSGQFSSIIDYFNMLNEVDTSDVPSAAEITNTRNVMREDHVTPSMPREEFLNNAPHREGGFVKVPSVLGEE